jgi:hypothetical protein
VSAESEAESLQLVLEGMNARKGAKKVPEERDEAAIVVAAATDAEDTTIPRGLRDLTVPPPSLRFLFEGPGRPPCDALSMMRAFLAAPRTGVADSPAAKPL